MKILPQFIDCVAFVCEPQQTGRATPAGTAFFVEVADETDPVQQWPYLITALHNLEESKGQRIVIRVNTVPNIEQTIGFKDQTTNKDDWAKHWNADVAALPVSFDPTIYSFQRVPLPIFIRSDYTLDAGAFAAHADPGHQALGVALKKVYPNGIPVEVGDPLFFPGLFAMSAGKNRILPIVRYGTISRMPGDELIGIQSAQGNRKEIRAYLAESLSWGGHSGSPVFWMHEYNLSADIMTILWRNKSPLDVRIDVPQKLEVLTAKGWVMGLLGFVSAHFDIPRRAQKLDVVTALNAGMAVLTPAENVRELLMTDEMKEDRRRRLAELKQQEPVATADSAYKQQKRHTRDVSIPPISREKFFKELTKATQRKK